MTDFGPQYVLLPERPSGPLSARNLEDYRQCPRKYLLSAFVTREQADSHVGGPAILSRAVRAALLSMYAAGGPDALPLGALERIFEDNWDGRACRDSREEEDLHRDGLRIIAAHHAAPLDLPSPLATDVRLEQEIGGEAFVAVADLVSAEGSHVARFTTSRRPPSPGQIANEMPWTTLFVLARAAHPGSTVLMVDLRRNRTVEVALDEAKEREATQMLLEVTAKINADRAFEPVTGKHCQWCRSRKDCPAWQR
ncbi:MAG: PD-(D/E)XK nuclease family protein [Acidobacteriota bacterium]|nr:PD-(D/E)XK nuclease family protein [Acidobacteriota bacterium]